MKPKADTLKARAKQIYAELRGTPGVTDDELWQHALFFARTPEERCRISLQAARLALSLMRSKRKSTMIRFEDQELYVAPMQSVIASKKAAGRDKDLATLPVLERTLRLARERKKKIARARRKPR